MGPPATQWDEVDPARGGAALYHEADLVHVPIDHHPGGVRVAGLLAEDAAEAIAGHLTDPIEVLPDQRSYLVLGSRRSGGQGKRAQQFFHFRLTTAHVFSLCCFQ